MKFESMELAPELVRAVVEMGYQTPTPIQQQAIPVAMSGRDVLGRAQTGTGKTAAFLLPLLQRLQGGAGLRALVLVPTRELAVQVAEAGRAFAKYSELDIGLVYGGTSVRDDLRNLRAGYDVLVATPGRLIDHLERGSVKMENLEVLVLDEADRMLDMGFRPQIKEILRHCPKQRQTLFFSATLPNDVRSLAYDSLNNPLGIEIAPQATAEGVEQFVYPVERSRKSDLLLELIERKKMKSAIVFVRTKRGADMVAARLRRANVSVALMHGDCAMRERESALESFRAGAAQVLVATDVAQRGLDVDGISHVINYDVPQEPESYVHRVGRTARAGAVGVAITLMSPVEIGDMRSIEHHVGRTLPRIELQGYGFGLATESVSGESVLPVVEIKKITRGGRRGMGSRATEALEADELARILNLGR